MKRYLTELIGTFFLVLTVGLVLTGSVQMGALAIGSVLMVMVYMGGHVSGGHYNPAVSLAVMLRGKLSPIDFVPYIVSQLAGSLLACYTVFTINGKTFAPAPGPDVTPFIAILVEAIFTFALCLVVLNVATAKGTEGNSFYGLAIGFTITVAAFVAGGISGGAFNPAVGCGPITFKYWMALKEGDKEAINHLGYYIVGPFLGAALAAGVFWIQNADWKVSMAGSEKK